MLFSAHHASYGESLEAGIHCFLVAVEVSDARTVHVMQWGTCFGVDKYSDTTTQVCLGYVSLGCHSIHGPTSTKQQSNVIWFTLHT